MVSRKGSPVSHSAKKKKALWLIRRLSRDPSPLTRHWSPNVENQTEFFQANGGVGDTVAGRCGFLASAARQFACEPPHRRISHRRGQMMRHGESFLTDARLRSRRSILCLLAFLKSQNANSGPSSELVHEEMPAGFWFLQCARRGESRGKTHAQCPKLPEASDTPTFKKKTV